MELADAGGIALETLKLELGVGIGNGERGASELVPVEPKDVVILALGLGVMLGGTVSSDDGTVELADAGGIALETLKLELGVGMGNGERGASEFVPVEAKDVVILSLELGVML